MYPIRRNLGHRVQHKCPQMHPRMRNYRFGRFVYNFFIIRQQIQIKDSCGVFNRPDATEIGFNAKQRLYKLLRALFRFDQKNAIMIPRLRRNRNGCRFIPPRTLFNQTPPLFQKLCPAFDTPFRMNCPNCRPCR